MNEHERPPTITTRDLLAIVNDTHRAGGWRARALGDHWPRLVEVALRELPAELEFEHARLGDPAVRSQWATRIKTRWKNDGFGIDPLTLLLISIAAKLIVELILRWLNNRGRYSQGRRLREFLVREYAHRKPEEKNDGER